MKEPSWTQNHGQQSFKLGERHFFMAGHEESFEADLGVLI
jgi:hypothetical protein